MSPTATYRVQFHAGFTFADALPWIPYWRDLGISHLYASPIATARAGSTHGYDAIDPTTINPALGGEAGFVALAKALKAVGLGVILDIVPNHVAVGGGDNAWWLDVLQDGQASAYAPYFDIDWSPANPALTGKVLAPFLGAPYGQALADGALRLDFEPELGRLSVLAHDTHRFPLRREDYAEVLQACGAVDLDGVDTDRLAEAYGSDDAGRNRLHALLERQHYRLAWWRTAGDEINWRRFFDITELAGLRIEEPAVFDTVHALPLRLYEQGLIDGLRVDHVDGLADPGAYGRRLRAALGAVEPRRPADAAPGPAWLVIEKILGPGESLAADWAVDGTTGYEFMNEVSALQHALAGAEPLARLWSQISGRSEDFAVEEEAARVEILTGGFAGQLDAAATAFHGLGQADIATRDLTVAGLRRALVAMVSVFPVYRTYGTGQDAPAADAAVRHKVVAEAVAKAPGDAEPIRQIAAWLAGQGPGAPLDRADAVRRFQQLSAPVSAKAVEDTAFYRFGRLLSRNDVGFDPARFSTTPDRFAALIAARSAAFPHAMLTTATHDHKRGEDIRARLAVLSEIPDDWRALASSWQGIDRLGVESADAYMLHQMIVGAWPIGLATDDAEGLAAFAERLSAWQTKALREGKLRSSWTLPNEAYEAAAEAYLRALMVDAAGQAFPDECARFVGRIAPAGVANSLVQSGLRLTLPGVPDLYQGTEYWDFSLVDPDNRSPVDYAARLASLSEASSGWGRGPDKQAFIAHLLSLRADEPALFADGEIRFLRVIGPRAEQMLAFERIAGDHGLIVVAALHCARDVMNLGAPNLPDGWWGDTTIETSRGPRRAADLAGGKVFATAGLD